ncbi:YifB family Mg chelatase-like AAA ATPase [Candidatus Dojkabacteria bacterium]|nr:YifB family Mg chelatase-like AAA ATPase [Candidatus Dojkabacteria bacterium]
MYSRVFSASNIGIQGYPVIVETHIARGLPRFSIIGLPDKTVKEAKERVSTAIKSSGFTLPLRRITVNLAPPNIPKHGNNFDLAIAVGILIASNQIKLQLTINMKRVVFIGGLSLNGTVEPTRGTPILVEAAAQEGYTNILISSSEEQITTKPDNTKVFYQKSLNSTVQFLQGNRSHLRTTPKIVPVPKNAPKADIANIYGKECAKRALIISAAGRHNISLSGPPGCGKTIVARSLSDIMPNLTPEEKLELHKIYSLCNEKLPLARPFRSPHHTITINSLIGGGAIPTPGEISLADKGVLFLDEFPLFGTKLINSLRQPLEDRSVLISRKSGTIIFPADFILVTAMNLCPCGFLNHPTKKCTCRVHEIKNFQNKISNAIWDRMDINITLASEKCSSVFKHDSTKGSDILRKTVESTWQTQSIRGIMNSQIQMSQIRDLCPMTSGAKSLIRDSSERLGLSTRGTLRTIRLSRTIADIENRRIIDENHMAEAISYRRNIVSAIG